MNIRADEPVWRVTVRLDDVPETGRHVKLDADEATRTAVARLAGVKSVSQLAADFEVKRRGRDGLRVVGEVRGTVEQTCVVSLEPMTSEIVEAVDVVYEPPRPEAPPVRGVEAKPEDVPNILEQEDPPEPLIDGVADLGALATEFLILGIDPYPRKPDAVFQPPAAGEGESGPFAALSKLKHGDDDGK